MKNHWYKKINKKIVQEWFQLKNIYFPKIHNLTALLSLANQANKEILDFENNCKILDKYYIETRYPGGALDVFKKQRAQEALDLTKEIIAFVKEQVVNELCAKQK